MQRNANLLSDVLGRRRFADFVIDTLVHFGADTVFGMPAESLTPLIDAIRRNGRLRLVTVRHEGNGALMASAHAKLTGKLGVAIGTAGPGVTHLPVGAYDAKADAAPLLAWCGQVFHRLIGTGGFQEIDGCGLLSDAASMLRRITSAEQTAVVPLACAHALRQSGVSVIESSNDILTQPVSAAAAVHMDPASLRRAPILDPGAVARAQQLLDGEGDAVIVVGQTSGFEQRGIEALAERLGAPIVVLPEGIEHFRGACRVPTLRARPELGALVARAARVVAVGPMTAALRALLDERAFVVQLAPEREAARPELGGVVRLCGATSHLLEVLLADLPARPEGALLAGARELAVERDEPEPWWDALDQVIAHDAVIACEPGAVLEGVFRHFPVRSRRFTSSYNHGARSYALPAGIAASLAYPDRQVVALASAGGLAESMAELMTARQHDAGVVTVCFAPRGGGIDFVEYARSVGLDARWAPCEARAVGDALGELTQLGAPSLLAIDRPAAVAPRSVAPSSRASFADWLVEGLARAGVTRIYARVRAPLVPLAQAARASGKLEVFDVVHPESAAMMASAHSKSTSELGVCAAADSRDLLLQLNGLYDAAFDHNPVVCLAPHGDDGVDGDRLLAGVSVSSATIDGGPGSARKLARALSEATRGRSVTHLGVDWARLAERVGPLPGWFDACHAPDAFLPAAVELAEAVRICETAARPVILVGRGGIGAREEIEVLAGRLDAAVVTTMPGTAAISTDHPLVVGCIGASGHRAAIEAVERCDVLLILGSSNRGAVFGLAGDFHIIQIDSDAMQLGRRDTRTLGLHGSIRPTLQALLAQLGPPRANGTMHPPSTPGGLGLLTGRLNGAWIEELDDGPLKRTLAILMDTPAGEAVQAAVRKLSGTDRVPLPIVQRQRFERWREHDRRRRYPGSTIAPPVICRAVQAALARRDQRATVTVDVGVMTLWVYRHFEGGPHRVVWTSSFATMGFALPAAVAIASRQSDGPVIAFVGDGGIAITMAELATAVAHQLPLVVVVFNNGKLAAVKFELEVMGWPEYAASLENCDFARYAEACGARGIRVTDADALDGAVEEALAHGGPCLIDVVCDGDYLPAPPKIHVSQGRGYAVAVLREAGIAARNRLAGTVNKRLT